MLKPNLFDLINLFGIDNVILEGKVEDKISNETRQRHITENCRVSGHGIAGHYRKFSCLINVAYRAMAHFCGKIANFCYK